MKTNISILISVLLAACGDNAAPTETPNPVDAPVDSAPMAIQALAVTTDFLSPGIGSLIDVSPNFSVQTNVLTNGAVSSDPVLRNLDHWYVVNRFGADNITVVSKDDLSVLDQFSTGANSNPQDIAVTATHYYVVALDSDSVLVFDKADTSLPPQTIDLSSLDSVDGIPDCNSVFLDGTTLFVSCGVLDRAGFPWIDRGVGKIAVVDTDTNTVTTTYDLTTANPFTQLRKFGSSVWVGTSPLADNTQGCVEKLSATGSTCVALNTAIGGNAISLVQSSSDAIWIAYSKGFDMNFKQLAGLKELTISSESLSADFAGTHNPVDLALCGTNTVIAADQLADGVVLFNNDQTVAEPTAISLGLPPLTNALACR